MTSQVPGGEGERTEQRRNGGPESSSTRRAEEQGAHHDDAEDGEGRERDEATQGRVCRPQRKPASGPRRGIRGGHGHIGTLTRAQPVPGGHLATVESVHRLARVALDHELRGVEAGGHHHDERIGSEEP